jgi:hypothetical protein
LGVTPNVTSGRITGLAKKKKIVYAGLDTNKNGSTVKKWKPVNEGYDELADII